MPDDCAPRPAPEASDAKPPSVSVVICAYTFDRLASVREAIYSVATQTVEPKEIIVVIDHNEALRDELARDPAPGVIVISNVKARGLSGARNTGVARATGDIVLFLDDDAAAGPGCIEASLAPFADPAVAGVLARIDPKCEDGKPAWFPDEFLWTVGCTYDGLAPGRVRNLIGAAMFVRLSILRAVGGFDSSLGRDAGKLPMGCEETEFCIRVARERPGAIFIYEPKGAVNHLVPPQRLSWRYFTLRCYAEGISKARLARLEGSKTSLSSERTYVRKTLVAAALRGMADTVFRGELSGIARAAAIATGLASAAAGFAIESVRMMRRRRSVLAPEATALVAPAPALTESAARLLKRATGSNYDLFSNAGLFAIGTGISSALGFVYWWFAARFYPPAAVGFAAGAVSLMNFIGHVGEIGLGALLMGELHRAAGRTGTVFSTALAASLVASALLGLGYLATAGTFHVALGTIARTELGGALFLLGCALTGLTLVLDQAMVGLLISGKQVQRNVTFAVVKFLILAAIPILIARSGRDEVAILATWVLGQLLSVVLLAADLRRTRAELFHKPDMTALKPLTGSIVGHHVLNLANLAPGLLLPFIVTVELSPTVNAAFFAAWMLVTVSYLVPASLASVLYTVAARGPDTARDKIRASMASSLVFGVCVAIVFWFGSNFILGLFNPAYPAIAGDSLKWLGLSIFPVIVKYHYVAIERVRGRMLAASLLVAAGCMLELAGALNGARHGDLHALTRNWLACFTLEALLMLPAVLTALGFTPAHLRRALAWKRPNAMLAFGATTDEAR